jgi:hypothetical protein
MRMASGEMKGRSKQCRNLNVVDRVYELMLSWSEAVYADEILLEEIPKESREIFKRDFIMKQLG